MRKGWLIYRELNATQNKTYIEWFISEAKRQHLDLELVLRESLIIGIKNGEQIMFRDGVQTTPPDFVIIRTIETLMQAYFEAQNIRTFNSSIVAQLANHKALTHVALQKLNIPMVETYFLDKASLPTALPLPFPFIMKDAHGRSGKQVFLINNEQEWQQKVHLLVSNDLLIQKLNYPLGRDVRVFIIGKEIIGAVLRENNNDFRANFTLGGSALKYHLTEDDEQMIHKIIEQFDFDLVGIDFLINEQGKLIFNEIEDVVGSRILSKVTEINLLEKYVAYIKEKLPLPV